MLLCPGLYVLVCCERVNNVHRSARNVCTQAYKTMAHMKQQSGDHMGAAAVAEEALAVGSPTERTELLLTAGVCYTARGHFYPAISRFAHCMATVCNTAGIVLPVPSRLVRCMHSDRHVQLYS